MHYHRRLGMIAASLLTWWTLFLLPSSVIHVAQAIPYLVLNSQQPKCFTVNAMARTDLAIIYHAPDLVVLPADDSEKHTANTNAREQMVKKPPPMKKGFFGIGTKNYGHSGMHAMQKAMAEQRQKQNQYMSGMDNLWKQKQGERSQEFARNQGVTSTISDLTITASVKAGPNPPIFPLVQRHAITEVDGMFSLSILEFGQVKICIQSLYATPINPSRVALQAEVMNKNVEEEDENGAQRYLKEQEEKKERKAAMKKLDEMNRKTLMQLDTFEQEMDYLIHQADLLLKNSDASKKQEAEFRLKSDQMNRSGRVYTIIQILVVIIASIVQARVMVKYFQSKHII